MPPRLSCKAFPRLTLVAPLALALLCAGCGRRESAASAGIVTQTLHVANNGEPSELDPHIINAPPDFKIVPMLFEGLLIGDPQTLAPRPGVAASWTLSDDALTHTFHLRADARWSNGDPVTAADFLFSWQRALTPALGSPYTFLFDAVRGAADYAAGRSTDFATVGFAAPDPHTLTITLDRPTPYFLALLANNPIWAPVHRATLEAAGDPAARGTGWTRPAVMVSNGPFQLREWRPNEYIRLEKSPTYWNADAVRLNALLFHVFDTYEGAERAFRAGQLHRTQNVPAARLAIHRQAGADGPLREVPSLIVQFINVNTSRPPLDDPRVRRALAFALDRDALAARIYFDAASPARGVVPAGLPGYPAADEFNDDVAAARAELAAAGFPDGRGFPALELSIEAGAANSLAEALQARWREVLGIQVSLVRTESRVHWSRLQQGDFALAGGGWVADYPDATAFLDLWRADGGWNFTGWTSPAYNAALDRAAARREPAARHRALREAEGILMEAMPVLPLIFQKATHLVHPAVRGLHDNAMDRPDYRTVWLETPAAGPP